MIMLTVELFTLFIFMTSLVSAYPLALPTNPTPRAQPNPSDASAPQSPLKSSSNSTSGFRTLQSLYDGNQKFRSKARVLAEAVPDEAPSFMFLGCVDSRLTPSTIFNAPAGSIISQNNIANQYSPNDPSVNAAIAYAIESQHVQHIIVLGHYDARVLKLPSQSHGQQVI